MTIEERAKESIIAQCRRMDKADVYEWCADNQIKIAENFQDRNNLIDYLENKVKELKNAQMILYEHANTKLVEKATVNSAIRSYQDILERIKNKNYE